MIERGGEDDIDRVASSGKVADVSAGKSEVQRGQRQQLRVDDERSGMRLDAVLGELFPGMGVRGRRRLVERGAILVNGHHGKPGRAVHAGDLIEAVNEQPMRSAQTSQRDGAPLARLLGVKDGFCFFAKPALLHTVRMAGSSEPSLEDQIPRLLAEAGSIPVEEERFQSVCPHVRLLQRLDFETSGIVAGALSSESQASFRFLERTGCVRKRYVCLLEGELQDEIVVASRIVSDGASRGRVRVLEENDPDPARETRFRPLCGVNSEDLPFDNEVTDRLMLVGVVIRRGSRHQIRAHAASIGYPLFGDALYGSKELLRNQLTAFLSLPPKIQVLAKKKYQDFFVKHPKDYILPDSCELAVACPSLLLHHGRISFGGLSFMILPSWPLPAECRLAVDRWFSEETEI